MLHDFDKLSDQDPILIILYQGTI